MEHGGCPTSKNTLEGDHGLALRTENIGSQRVCINFRISSEQGRALGDRENIMSVGASKRTFHGCRDETRRLVK